MKMFSVTIVSPEKMLYRGSAEEVIVPGQEGAMSVLSRHAPLLATLKKGEISIISDSSRKRFETASGFIEISKKEEGEPHSGSFVNIFIRQA